MTPAPIHHLRPLRVGVAPASELAMRQRLFAALEEMYPVVFEGRAAGELGQLEAVISFGEATATELPQLVAVGREGTPAATAREARLAQDHRLERPLRGARLHDGAAVALPAAVAAAGGTVLASLEDAPFWLRRGATELVGAAPDELAEGELLRERLLPGRNLALLALTHFLRGLTAARDWRPPPLRAAFVLDDPNLHWPTYGHLRYRELLDHAALHRYHLAVAMIPLDAWLAHPGVARMFREGADRLSIQVHGNDHDGGELGRVHSDAAGIGLASQALRRIERFERRTGVHVARVMAPPHERITEPALRGLLASGFEGVSTARPFPWMPADAGSWLAHPPGTPASAVFTPSHETPGGLPVVLRFDFNHPREELVLRAYLGQPLVVYGHHEDLADGLDVLAEAADQINALGDVRWLALDGIARGAAQTRLEGQTLHVRPLARRIVVDVPAGVEEVRVAAGACATEPRVLPWSGDEAAICELQLVEDVAALASRTRPRMWPLARRIATEGRDRLRAVI
jgi:hypothetical protein